MPLRLQRLFIWASIPLTSNGFQSDIEIQPNVHKLIFYDVVNTLLGTMEYRNVDHKNTIKNNSL